MHPRPISQAPASAHERNSDAKMCGDSAIRRPVQADAACLCIEAVLPDACASVRFRAVLRSTREAAIRSCGAFVESRATMRAHRPGGRVRQALLSTRSAP
ncbi:hypothetical protein [Lysobacter gummosus]|uniref:hypothetical protein n=1 Tax=Lysobacter gummosus TaxID=262324 RepID=UPI00364192AE